MDIVSGIEEYSKNLDWDIFPIFYDNINLLPKLIEKENIDGIIGSFASEHMSYIKQSLPIVNISSVSKIDNMSSVLNDNYKSGQLAASHFCNNNLKHLYFCGQNTQNSSKIMEDGYMSFAESKKVVASKSPSFFLNENNDRIIEWLKNIEKPSGIFCTNSILARHIIQSAKDIELNIPDDISVVVWNGSKLDSLIAGIELSSISADGYKQGIKAAQILNQLFDNPDNRYMEHISPKNIYIGLSSSFIAGKHPKYAQAYTYILNNFNSYINIGEIAKKIGVSRRKLELIFNEESSMSPYQTIIYERIKHAKKLLMQSDYKIIEIAEMCGFSEQRQLSVTFKKTTGVCPKKFREDWNKKL
jgi:DNA-binding LacI/PurR family transcriptional regulator